MRRRRQLSTRILASVVGILLASTLVGFALVTHRQRAEFEHDYQQRALVLAQTFAATPSIREALARRSPADPKVPIRAPPRTPPPIIGEVSAGILEGPVSDQLLHELPSLLLYFACALAIGVVASLMLARRLKRSTFGLELEEIAALMQERE